MCNIVNRNNFSLPKLFVVKSTKETIVWIYILGERYMNKTKYVKSTLPEILNFIIIIIIIIII